MPPLRAEVVTVDQLGDSVVAHLSVRSESQRNSLWVARTSSDSLESLGDKVGLNIESDHVHLFDTQSGDNLLKE